MYISNKSCNFATSNKTKQLKTFRTMKKIKQFIELVEAHSIEQVRSEVSEYIEAYHGHVVSGLFEAEGWLRGKDDTRDAQYGESVRVNLDSVEDGEIYVRVTEVYMNGGDSDYCYTIDVDYQSKIENDMKNAIKIKVAAVAAVFALATLISTVVLVAIDHHAQWCAAGVFAILFGIALFTICTID